MMNPKRSDRKGKKVEKMNCEDSKGIQNRANRTFLLLYLCGIETSICQLWLGYWLVEMDVLRST